MQKEVAGALTGLLAAAGCSTMAAAAMPCGATVDARFRDAAALCGSTATPPWRPAAAMPTDHPDPVSVRMRPASTMLDRAAVVVRSGGGATMPGLVFRVARAYRIDPPLLASVVAAESGGRIDAVSRTGALGLMQVMPGTARSMGVREPRALLRDPALALSTGALYLKTLQARFGNRPDLVVAAYNAGPGAVERAGMQVPRYRETRSYVGQVLHRYAGARRVRVGVRRHGGIYGG